MKRFDSFRAQVTPMILAIAGAVVVLADSGLGHAQSLQEVIASKLSTTGRAAGAAVFDVPKVEGLAIDGSPGDWKDAGFRVVK